MSPVKIITNEMLSAYLEELEVPHGVDDEGDVYAVFGADEDFAHDVIFYFYMEEGGWLGIQAFADGFDLAEGQLPHALEIINVFSIKAKLPKVIVYNNRFKVEQWTVFDGPTSDGFIKEYIRLVMTVSWQFFVEADKKLQTD